MMPVRKGLHFSEVSLGRNITNYDSMIVLTHFKGHAMGGYGGSLKNIAIGCADGQVGKRQIQLSMNRGFLSAPTGRTIWFSKKALWKHGRLRQGYL